MREFWLRPISDAPAALQQCPSVWLGEPTFNRCDCRPSGDQPRNVAQWLSIVADAGLQATTLFNRAELPRSGAAMPNARRHAAELHSGGDDSMTPIRAGITAIAVGIALGSIGGAGPTQRSTREPKVSGTVPPSRRVADGMECTIPNLDVNASPSYCRDDSVPNCRRYGGLYTWASA